jgi:hypothetical protein
MITPRYIPENSTVITAHGATVYTYTSKDNKPAAIAYIGSSSKKHWHYRFMNDAQRTAKIAELLENMKTQEEFKNARKAEKATFKHGFKVGEFLYSSWGYDQTNVEYYQITATTAKTVTFREVKQQGEYNGHAMTGTCSPVANDFLSDKEFTRTARPCSRMGTDGEKGAVEFAESKGDYQKSLWAWDGHPKGYSTYA